MKRIKAKSITILSQNSFLLNQMAHCPKEIASLTKIMTCYLSLLLIRIYKIGTKSLVKVSRTAS